MYTFIVICPDLKCQSVLNLKRINAGDRRAVMVDGGTTTNKYVAAIILVTHLIAIQS